MSNHYTVVSVCNFQVGPEYKSGVFPSTYTIPPAEDGSYSTLRIEEGFHDIPQLDYKTIRVPVSPKEIANSVVNDYRRDSLEVSDGAMPGLFCVEGDFSPNTNEAHEELLSQAVGQHTNWTQRLIRMGDSNWNVKKDHRQITDIIRSAADYLHVQREWNSKMRPDDFSKCPACRTLIDSEAAICAHCGAVVDATKAESFVFAGR